MPEVKVPELAESITEGTIAEWLKNVGDSVDKGEAILELETDKVNVEVVSEEAGVLSEQLVKAVATHQVVLQMKLHKKKNLKMLANLKINHNNHNHLQIIN